MNDTQLFQSMSKILNQDVIDSLKKIVIIDDKDGYRVWDKYIVSKSTAGVKVRKIYDDKVRLFTSLKYALAWCTLDNRNLILDSNRLRFLDSILAGSELSTKLYEKYIRSNSDKKIIYSTKLFELRLKTRKILKELDELANKARKYQLSTLKQSSLK